MLSPTTFQRRGIVEGFFGPMWSMAHRKRLFRFGAARGMNTYLYAPKDDPYHRKHWRTPYPKQLWGEMLQLIRAAQRNRIDFVFGFHPGEGLVFAEDEPVRILIRKARRFFDAGVRVFAVLFDDIPSRLAHERDRKYYGNSLARAQGNWLARIREQQPSAWRDVEWWICPSYYTPDPLLARIFGAFEPEFLEKLAAALPRETACLWTGPAVVSRTITAAHIRELQKTLQRHIVLWDNYPVNDLSMSDELHLAPLSGRDPRLPRVAYGYLNNPLLQENLSFVPLATCFDYARNPAAYRAEQSWSQAVHEQFGVAALAHWRTLRWFFDLTRAAKHRKTVARIPENARPKLRAALSYIHRNKTRPWAHEIAPFYKHLSRVC